MKNNILFITASIRSHVLPALYLSDLLAEQYEIYFTVSNDILNELVLGNGFKPIRCSIIRPLIGMESNFIANKKKQQVSFKTLAKAYLKNEIFEYRKTELNTILLQIKPVIVIIDIYSSTDFLVLKTHPSKPKLLFFNPMLSTYRVNGFPIVSEGNWLKQQTLIPSKKEDKNNWLTFIKQPKASLLRYLNERQNQKVFAESGVSEVMIDKNNPFTMMFREIPELILAPLELEFSPKVQHPWQYYLGLCIREKRHDPELDLFFESRWKSIIEKKNQGQKIIYCSFGTFYEGADKKFLMFLENLFQVIEELGNNQLIISVNRFIIETILLDKSKNNLKMRGLR